MAHLMKPISFAEVFADTNYENCLLTGIFDDYGINYVTTRETINIPKRMN
jgi:hypothetical protein